MLLRAWVTVSGVLAVALAASCAFDTGGLGTTSSSSSSSAASSSGAGGAASQPTCADGVTNGLETDVDCGGDACPPCPLGQSCDDGADCASGTCTSGRCAPASSMCELVSPGSPSCGDCLKNGLETDIDCGGDACPPCAIGRACAVAADCATGACQAGVCILGAPSCQPVDPENPSCADCVTNGMETGVDCGGDACPPCGASQACLDAADCMSRQCVGHACQPGSPGSPCRLGTDCASTVCAPGVCWTGLCCG